MNIKHLWVMLFILAGCGDTIVPVSIPTPVSVPPPPTNQPPAPQCFHLYESLIYSNVPDFSSYGFSHIEIVDPSHNKDGVLKTDDHQTILIDWEGQGIATLDDALIWARQNGYEGPLSFYAMIPERDYWRSISPVNGASYAQWQSENDALKPIVDKVEAIYPSLYTFYPDQDGWVIYAATNMSEGRRIAPDKKMYPFLWPYYHDSTNAELPADYWLMELRTVRDNADGIVLWSGWDFHNNKPMQWDENSAWWQATLQFINETPNICEY